MRWFEACLWIAAGAVAAPAAQAFRAIDAPPPTRAAVLNAPRPDPAVESDNSTSLRQGVVTAVSPNADAVFVNGTWLRIEPGVTQLYRQGQATQSSQLNKGQLVRFTLAPGSADRRTLGVVYVP